MKDQGSYVSRVMGGVKGALSDLGNLSNVGPKSQNGGEVIISAGECLSSESILAADRKEGNASIFIGCRTQLITRTSRHLPSYSTRSSLVRERRRGRRTSK